MALSWNEIKERANIRTLIFMLIILSIWGCNSKQVEKSCDDNEFILESKDYYPKSKLIRSETFTCPEDTNWKLIKKYYENGNLFANAYYFLGKRSGHWTLYSENGKKSFEGNFISGLKEGNHTIFHDNGKVHIEEFYQNGKEVGKWYYFDSISEQVYKTENY